MGVGGRVGAGCPGGTSTAFQPPSRCITNTSPGLPDLIPCDAATGKRAKRQPREQES